jgi:hypothetical protein
VSEPVVEYDADWHPIITHGMRLDALRNMASYLRGTAAQLKRDSEEFENSAKLLEHFAKIWEADR